MEADVTVIPVPVPVPAMLNRGLFDAFVSAVLSSGWIGVAGWLTILGVIITACIVIIRHYFIRDCHRSGTYFYAITHVGTLIFLNNVGVPGLIIACASGSNKDLVDAGIIAINYGQSMLSLATGLIIILILTGIVSLITKTKPKPTAISSAGIAAAMISYLILVGGILMITGLI